MAQALGGLGQGKAGSADAGFDPLRVHDLTLPLGTPVGAAPYPTVLVVSSGVKGPDTFALS